MNQQTIREVVDFAALQPSSSYLVMKEKFFFLFGHIYTCVRGLDLGVDMFSGYLRSPGAGWSYGVGSRGVTLLFSESATPRLVWNFSESRLDVWKVAFIIVTWDVWEERRSPVNNEQQQATARMQMFNLKVLAVGLNYMSREEARNGWLGLKLSEVLLCWLRVRWRLEFCERFLTNAFFFCILSGFEIDLQIVTFCFLYRIEAISKLFQTHKIRFSFIPFKSKHYHLIKKHSPIDNNRYCPLIPFPKSMKTNKIISPKIVQT